MGLQPSPISRDICDRPAPDLAPMLIGAMLLIRGAGGIITETEAYRRDDPASHSHTGPSPRNRAMFGPAGRTYVYRSYGIHLCLNVVAQEGEAVLIRSILPQLGLDLMASRRAPPFGTGPGRVGRSLGITLDDNGRPFDGEDFSIHLAVESPALIRGPRIGITKAVDLPWRFVMKDVAEARFAPFHSA